MKFGPVPASIGSLLTIDALATSGLERRHLGDGVLVVGGDSGIADLHCKCIANRTTNAIPFRNARTTGNTGDARSLRIR
jgi:hypothetical protein